MINCWDDPNYSDLWIFAIDTNSYAGNFGQELSAFITGIPGEHKGETEANDYCDTFELNIDERGMEWGEEYEYMPNEYGGDIFSMFMLPDPKGRFKSEDGSSCGANNGLAIYLNKRPTQEMIDRMKERAIEFAQGNDRYGDKRNIKILKFRLIHREVQVSETEIEIQ